MAELPITLEYEWFSSTSTKTWATTGIFPVPPGLLTLTPPHPACAIVSATSNEICNKSVLMSHPFDGAFFMAKLEVQWGAQVAPIILGFCPPKGMNCNVFPDSGNTELEFCSRANSRV